jgi:dipeptidyl aminopeptidase/acylaminoacyl peptidase
MMSNTLNTLNIDSIALFAIISIFIIIIIMNVIAHNIIEYYLLEPEYVDDIVYSEFLKTPNMIHETIYLNNNNSETIDACLYKRNIKPSYQDEYIYLYSHGNSGCLNSVITTSTVQHLASIHSVFLYDYRGFGMSKGCASKINVVNDVYSAWRYLVDIKHVDPMRIILFGHSFGASMTAILTERLVKENTLFSGRCILQNGFSDLYKIFDDSGFVPGIVVRMGYNTPNTKDVLKRLDNNYKKSNQFKLHIVVIHSINDKRVHYDHSVRIVKNIKNIKIDLFLIPGSHNDLEYNAKINRCLTPKYS